MTNTSSKNKIFIGFALWLFCLVLVFVYGFSYVEARNEKIRERIREVEREQAVLRAEKESFEKAQAELSELETRPLQPENFFSRDITLVNEIKFLENLGKRLGLVMNIGGISGTVNTAAKAKTQGEIVVIPYSISARGSFDQILRLLDSMENLPFLSGIGSLNINSADQGVIQSNFSANFYIRR